MLGDRRREGECVCERAKQESQAREPGKRAAESESRARKRERRGEVRIRLNLTLPYYPPIRAASVVSINIPELDRS